MKPEHYSMFIQWDARDAIYVVSVPEISGCKTHGKTREEAIKNGLEVIELWLETAKDLGWPIPQPQTVAD
jgi:predicted RNase H-like HicB family nuclease